MLYLTGCIPAKPDLQQQLLENNVGALLTPYSQRHAPSADWAWAADNGCFAERWQEQKWLNWLSSRTDPATALFATVPDVVCDHNATLDRWQQYASVVQGLGFAPAFVLQDGATLETLPMAEMGALFIGGSTEYKTSDEAHRLVKSCQRHGKWIHMGRVNSARRLRLAYDWGCDSVDGTFLAFGPDVNTPKLLRMIYNATQPSLWTSCD